MYADKNTKGPGVEDIRGSRGWIAEMNDYQIVQDVGRSKYSLVYKGRKKKTVMFYALKCVDKSQKRKIMHEVKFLRKFSSGFHAQNAPAAPRSCLRYPIDFIIRIHARIHS